MNLDEAVTKSSETGPLMFSTLSELHFRAEFTLIEPLTDFRLIDSGELNLERLMAELTEETLILGALTSPDEVTEPFVEDIDTFELQLSDWVCEDGKDQASFSENVHRGM